MIRTRKSITIERPVDEVFEYMAHFENDMEWRNELLEIQRTSSVAEGEGATYRQRVQLEGIEGETILEVIGFEPNRLIAFEEAGDLAARGQYRFDPEDGRTRVEVSEDIELRGALEPAGRSLDETVRQQGELDLEHLKDILEHRKAWRR
jgi:uncharacterized membrane protein